MIWTLQYLWLIPALPLFAAAILSVTSRPNRRLAATLAIGAMAISFLLSAKAFLLTLSQDAPQHLTHNFIWFSIGESSLRIGWLLDPLTAIMLVMVCFISLLVFIYSVGYMAHDENFTRFFCFLSLFAAAMLGLLIANNLLLLFMCWEVVGVSSYLLIGFWYHKPSAAAAAKKAFITTRIGDLLFFIGILFLYSQAGTLLFYDAGNGCLEPGMITELVGRTSAGGIAVTTAIGLLIFCGAVGKSGQVPLHVWLPDAMEGPTPVSALIHAATMVAAGVFLIARVFPLLDPNVIHVDGPVTALIVVTWVGAITAIFAASIAVAQTDLKRILAYSTVSQLGFMMMGLGVGGVGVGMFHLLTHAFFKALLFLGAGSVIHGCHGEQDIREMGGLRKLMPVTFATYAIGMMALSGVPLFAGFWSKDDILHSAHAWPWSQIPYALGVIAALLTAFYMTRQVCYVFFGPNRWADEMETPHESPRIMTIPLAILAMFAAVLGFIGTPVWPWLQNYLGDRSTVFNFRELTQTSFVTILLTSSVIALAGIGIGWWLYGLDEVDDPEQPDALEKFQPDIFFLLQNKFFVDEFYQATVIRFNAWFAGFCDDVDYWFWNGGVIAIGYVVIGLSWVSCVFDEYVIDLGFYESCRGVTSGGKFLSHLQNGRVQNYLRVIGVAFAALGLFLLWGCQAP